MINIKKTFVLAVALIAASSYATSWAQEEGTPPVAPQPSVAPQPAAATAAVPVAGANSVQFEQMQSAPAILVKLNNVKSIRDEEGLAFACDFDAVVFNRSDDHITGASIDLSWKDETIAAFLEGEAALQKAREKAKAAEEARQARLAGPNNKAAAPAARVSRRAARAPVERDSDAPDLVFTLDIPEIKPFSQVVITSRLKSDKCFLLVHEATINARACNAATAANAPSPGRNVPTHRNPAQKSGGGCIGMFEFISSRNPQFYREFKNIDPEAEKMARLSRQELIKQEVEGDYQRALQAMDAIAKELDTIR